MKPKKPVQFHFIERGVQMLDELKEQLDFSSRAEVIRLALNFLAWFIESLKNGYEITVSRGDGHSESMVIPFLEIRSLQRNHTKKWQEKQEQNRKLGQKREKEEEEKAKEQKEKVTLTSKQKEVIQI